jgi:hypothetical protein
MQVSPQNDVYSAHEIGLAAGVAEADVAALIGSRTHASYGEAVRIARALRRRGPVMFSQAGTHRGAKCVPLALSSTLHLGLIGAGLMVAAWVSVPAATMLVTTDRPDPIRVVFLATPGPGGGGGGGGLLQRAPAQSASGGTTGAQQSASGFQAGNKTRAACTATRGAFAPGPRANRGGSGRLAKSDRRID